MFLIPIFGAQVLTCECATFLCETHSIKGFALELGHILIAVITDTLIMVLVSSHSNLFEDLVYVSSTGNQSSDELQWLDNDWSGVRQTDRPRSGREERCPVRAQVPDAFGNGIWRVKDIQLCALMYDPGVVWWNQCSLTDHWCESHAIS